MVTAHALRLTTRPRPHATAAPTPSASDGVAAPAGADRDASQFLEWKPMSTHTSELLLQSVVEIVGAAVYGVMQRSERNSGSVQDS